MLAVTKPQPLGLLAAPEAELEVRSAWRVAVGVDVFGGKDRGVFGVYDKEDRAWLELRRWF